MKKTDTKKGAVSNGCIYYRKCGGCQLSNLSYEEQLSYKQGKVIANLRRFVKVDPITGMENPSRYRCKVQAAFDRGRNGIISGIYQSSTHKIVPTDTCLLEDEGADRIIVTIRKLASIHKIRPFENERMQGFLRHVQIRKGYYTSQYMVILVTAKEQFPAKDAFIRDLVSVHPEITTVIQNINAKFTSLVMGEKNITLYGPGHIEDSLLGMTFRISPGAFYQINPPMTEKLYSCALEYLDLKGDERVIDAYCGTGTIGLLASRRAKEVIGIESSSSAVGDAKVNAEINGVGNIRFFCADASDFLSEITNEKIDAVIMDPPRTGSTPKFINSVIALAPEKIVYVSCAPETLSRDLALLVRGGYKARKARAFDLFPHTNHVETALLLSRA